MRRQSFYRGCPQRQARRGHSHSARSSRPFHDGGQINKVVNHDLSLSRNDLVHKSSLNKPLCMLDPGLQNQGLRNPSISSGTSTMRTDLAHVRLLASTAVQSSAIRCSNKSSTPSKAGEQRKQLACLAHVQHVADRF